MSKPQSQGQPQSVAGLPPAQCSANSLRALSLWQPWASAMASGVKQMETRSWPTSYRGDLVICSAKRKPKPEEMPADVPFKFAVALPYGYALCVVELYDCHTVEWIVRQRGFTEAERDWGDYTPGIGRYAWLTRNCRRLQNPVPIVGRQGLWTLPPETLAMIQENLPNIRI